MDIIMDGARIYRSVAAAFKNRANVFCAVVFLFSSVAVIGTCKTTPTYVTVCGVLAAIGSACAGLKKTRRCPREESCDIEAHIIPTHPTHEVPGETASDIGTPVPTAAQANTDTGNVEGSSNTATTSPMLHSQMQRTSQQTTLDPPEADITEIGPTALERYSEDIVRLEYAVQSTSTAVEVSRLGTAISTSLLRSRVMRPSLVHYTTVDGIENARADIASQWPDNAPIMPARVAMRNTSMPCSFFAEVPSFEPRIRVLWNGGKKDLRHIIPGRAVKCTDSRRVQPRGDLRERRISTRPSAKAKAPSGYHYELLVRRRAAPLSDAALVSSTEDKGRGGTPQLQLPAALEVSKSASPQEPRVAPGCSEVNPSLTCCANADLSPCPSPPLHPAHVAAPMHELTPGMRWADKRTGKGSEALLSGDIDRHLAIAISLFGAATQRQGFHPSRDAKALCDHYTTFSPSCTLQEFLRARENRDPFGCHKAGGNMARGRAKRCHPPASSTMSSQIACA